MSAAGMPGASGAPAPGGSKQAEGAIERAVAALSPGPLTEAALDLTFFPELLEVRTAIGA